MCYGTCTILLFDGSEVFIVKVINVNVEETLLSKLDSLAKRKAITRSAFVREALESYVNDAECQYDNIPTEVVERVSFLMLLVVNGERDKDWEFVGNEVVELWKIMQS